jgi:hypothetical protein
MRPPNKTYDQAAGVSIGGSVGNVGGDIIGGDKITYGIDEEKLNSILERFAQKMAGDTVLLRQAPALQFTAGQKQATAHRPPSEITRDLVSSLRTALGEIINIISDLDEDRDVDLANSRLSRWKQKTDDVINKLLKDENIQYKLQLYSIIPDTNQRTPFNKIKNEGRKCQKAVADLIREFG